jgi:predicted aldo/keto reductase-like oxidoreductase
METSRRDLIKLTAAAAGVTAAFAAGSDFLYAADEASSSDVPQFRTPESERRGDMLYRKLGSTGETVSLIGLGGFHIGNIKKEADSVKLVRAAIDRGITFMDNSWDYHDGGSEMRMGKALKDGYREKVFLMTKIDGRTKQSAAKQLDESLRRLQTDHIDLVQHHEIIRMEDPDRIFSEGGANEALLEAKKAGKLRFIGFTGHKDPLVHSRMLEISKQHNFKPDTVQMPLNLMDAHFRSFAHVVLPQLLEQQIGVLGMKSMGDGNVLKSKTVTPIECLHYAMNLPTSVVITGIDSEKILDQAFEAVKTFQPMDRQQVAALLDKTKDAAATGKFEPFKTSSMFDSTAQHPQWLG